MLIRTKAGDCEPGWDGERRSAMLGHAQRRRKQCSHGRLGIKTPWTRTRPEDNCPLNADQASRHTSASHHACSHPIPWGRIKPERMCGRRASAGGGASTQRSTTREQTKSVATYLRADPTVGKPSLKSM